jgi:hypothetical protein
VLDRRHGHGRRRHSRRAAAVTDATSRA